MAERRFDIIFDGSVINGSKVTDVKANLKALFKLDDNSIEKLFCGTPIAIKKNLDRQSATQYQTALSQAGAKIQLVLHRDSSTAKPVETAISAEAGMQLLPPGSPLLTGQERPSVTPVEVNIDHLELIKANPFISEVLPEATSEGLANSSATVNSIANNAETVFTLAKTGTDTGVAVQQDELPIVPPNIDHLDVEPLGTDLLAGIEQAETAAAPKLSANLSLCEPGSDILRSDERPVYSAVEVDISGLTLSEDNT